ncbi:MAG: ATP-binding protein [Candidatus Thiodiazotropha weberae]|uniref:two-component system sensor histidine kinase NtrB n=1 Tax=Candidatus Thiodiazotropha endoloripes TaxID=1818881 RepID=UPI00083D33B5|nr:ATP-binding protein [Candidatus Thiodiazotropha endoloripes]MCG7899336.1 ATP-binding protein [Candidatus Thiodiazotropha weberae]ODB83822.1 histidine kinase [Candidatus Thiodiazotropha endoloripes]ODB90584.1 histidine kinase [Candidatus Thiodiazotropha endoloripes]
MNSWLEKLEQTIITEPPGKEMGAVSHWRSLRLFLLYRITLSLTLLFFFHADSGPAFIGSTDPRLFNITILTYSALTILSSLLFIRRSPGPEHQAYLALFIDILAITLLMYASGGIQTGLGMLIAVSISAGALIMGGRASLLFAALAALAVITDQVHASLSNRASPQFIQAGFLGAVYFATALLTWVLSSRARASERLAEKRASELDHMAKINAYVIKHMQTGVLVIDASGRILMMNDPAWHLLGMPSATTGSHLAKASPELAHIVRKRQNPKRKQKLTFRSQSQGPELKAQFNALSGEEAGDMLIFLEDTSQVTREAQQMKLASLGRLTASIAHEIRNPLGAISHASQLFRESPSLNVADKRLTEIITTNAARVNQVIENVLQLSRREPGQQVTIQLDPWLKKLTSDLIRHQGFKEESIRLQIDPVSTKVFADPEQLRQLVSNLCNNAREHCDKKNLQLRIVGGMTKEYQHPILDVLDNGPGIAPEVAKQIFEPFFTTRNTGTGLGLYIAKELSETNRIRLEYIPGPTGGSCFRLHFENWQPEKQQA